jgi:hypothetical protein
MIIVSRKASSRAAVAMAGSNGQIVSIIENPNYSIVDITW